MEPAARLALVTTASATALATSEPERLLALEDNIAEGMRTCMRKFIEVGTALAEIRDDGLYQRRSYPTFERYCEECWGLSRAQAYRMIQAAEVVDVLSPIGDIPATEGVARELAPLRSEPTNLREAWLEVVEQHGDHPTAAEVREVVRAKVNKPERIERSHTTCPVCRGTGSVRTDRPLGWTKKEN
jgi:hypothetical protein